MPQVCRLLSLYPVRPLVLLRALRPSTYLRILWRAITTLLELHMGGSRQVPQCLCAIKGGSIDHPCAIQKASIDHLCAIIHGGCSRWSSSGTIMKGSVETCRFPRVPKNQRKQISQTQFCFSSLNLLFGHFRNCTRGGWTLVL